jgi:hypothetical protein
VSDVSDGGTCPERITRTYRASDECGNSTECVQVITIDDTIAPVLTCPADVTLPCGSTPVCGDPTATDGCDPAPDIILLSSVTTPGPNGSTITTCTWEARDDCNNVSAQCSQVITVEGCPEIGYTSLTQGDYGSPGGNFNGYGTLDLIRQILSNGPLVVGVPGRSLAIPQSAAACVLMRLPAGGNSTALPGIGDAIFSAPNCQTSPKLGLDSNGKLRNQLLGQTIALALSARLDDAGIVDHDLAEFGLEPLFCTQGSLPGPDGLFGTADDEIDLQSPVRSFTIPGSVLTALSNLGLPRDVGGLLALANRGLGGLTTGGASLTNIATAIDAVNRGFDRARFLVPCSVAAKSGAPAQITAARTGGAMDSGEDEMVLAEAPLGAPARFELGQCYPNPFRPATQFTLGLPAATEWTVDIYSVSGHLVRRLSGEAARAEYVRIEWDGRNDAGDRVTPGIYFYRAVAGNMSATRKAILLD